MRHQLRTGSGRDSFRTLFGALATVVMLALATIGCSDGSNAVPLRATVQSSTASAVAETTSSAEPTPSAVSRPLAESRPVRVRIPAIDVSSELMSLGLRDDGTMEVPPNGFPAGWYTEAPTPGELGPAIIAGHVRWQGAPGVFANLEELSPGDEIIISREDGIIVTFHVTRVENHLKSEFPTDEVYGDIDHAGVRLITCGGLDPATRTYNDNVVVFAKLAGSRPHW